MFFDMNNLTFFQKEENNHVRYQASYMVIWKISSFFGEVSSIQILFMYLGRRINERIA